MKKAVVIGGGFAGIQAAIELQKSGKFEVMLISERDFMYINPVSIWIPVRLAEFDDVKIPLKNIQKKYNFKLIIDKVTEIKTKENTVVCENQKYEFDYLIIAVGADKMSHTGIENTFSICGKPETALDIREKLDELIAKGNGKIAVGFGGNPKDKSAVRGGPAFELIFNIQHYLNKKKIRNNFELTFFAPMPNPGVKMGESAMKMVDKMFLKYNIKKRFGKKIKEFKQNEIVFEDDSTLNSDLTLYIPGLSGNKILKNADIPLSKSGFIMIDDNCSVQGISNVYAVGDNTAFEDPEWIAKQGHFAELTARIAALNIIATENGNSKRKSYKNYFNIICLMDAGNGAAFVFRNEKRAFVIPLPIVGHWLKKSWAIYAKISKTGFRLRYGTRVF